MFTSVIASSLRISLLFKMKVPTNCSFSCGERGRLSSSSFSAISSSSCLSSALIMGESSDTLCLPAYSFDTPNGFDIPMSICRVLF